MQIKTSVRTISHPTAKNSSGEDKRLHKLEPVQGANGTAVLAHWASSNTLRDGHSLEPSNAIPGCVPVKICAYVNQKHSTAVLK